MPKRHPHHAAQCESNREIYQDTNQGPWYKITVPRWSPHEEALGRRVANSPTNALSIYETGGCQPVKDVLLPLPKFSGNAPRVEERVRPRIVEEENAQKIGKQLLLLHALHATHK